MPRPRHDADRIRLTTNHFDKGQCLIDGRWSFINFGVGDDAEKGTEHKIRIKEGGFFAESFRQPLMIKMMIGLIGTMGMDKNIDVTEFHGLKRIHMIEEIGVGVDIDTLMNAITVKGGEFDYARGLLAFFLSHQHD